MKAFDSVPHHRLLSKLAAYGIQGPVLTWIKGFLLGRQQRVVVNGQQSKWSDVKSGIPQGSVLGPTLFVIYINDLPDLVKSGVKLFADDTKLYARSDTNEASLQLQADLDGLQDWAEKWQMKFHPDKCTVLKVGRIPSEHKYVMRNGDEQITLGETTVEKDLGVLVDPHLNFHEHISQAVSRANRLLGLIRRSFLNLDTETFNLLYKGLIRPILEYSQAVWSPHKLGEQRMIEGIQRRATKMIPAIKDLTYQGRLKHLKLPTLVHRRKRGDMIDVFKYMHGLYNTDVPLFRLSTEERTRGNTLKLTKAYARLDVRKHFFSNRIIDEWNSLPDEVVTAPSVNSFKTRLDKHWKNDALMYEPI